MSAEDSVVANLTDLKRVAEVADEVGAADRPVDVLRILLAFRAEVRAQCEAECARDARLWRNARPLFQWSPGALPRDGRWNASLYVSEQLPLEDAIEKLQQL